MYELDIGTLSVLGGGRADCEGSDPSRPVLRVEEARTRSVKAIPSPASERDVLVRAGDPIYKSYTDQNNAHAQLR